MRINGIEAEGSWAHLRGDVEAILEKVTAPT